MATVYGVNATKNNAPTHQNIIDPSEQGGRVRWIHDVYEASAAPSGTNIIMGGLIPKGAQIVPGASYLYCDDTGSANAIIGITEDGEELMASTTIGTAAGLPLANTVDLFGTKLTTPSNVWVQIDGSTTGTLRLSLMYVMA